MFLESSAGGFNPYAGIAAYDPGNGESPRAGLDPAAYSADNYASMLNAEQLRALGAPPGTLPGGTMDDQSNNLNPAFTKWLIDNQYSLTGGIESNGDNAARLTDSGGRDLATGSVANDKDFFRNAMMLMGGWGGATALAGGFGGAGGALGAEGGALGIEGATYAMPGAEGGFGLMNAGAAGAEGAGGLGTVGGGMTAGGASLGGGAGYAGGAGMTGAIGAGGLGAGGAGASSWLPASFGINNGTALSLGGNLLSGVMGSRAAGKAAGAQLDAGRESNALQKYQFDTARSDLAPYREAGTGALAQIQALLKNPGSITQDPGYQFGLDQGAKTLANGAAARGMTYSGQQGKALQKYGSDYASTKLNESYNRLAGVAGIGQQATNSGNSLGANYGQSVGNTMQGMGNARASSYMGGANAWSGAIGNALNAYQDNDVSNRYYRRGG